MSDDKNKHLDKYRSKRDFRSTSEPDGSQSSQSDKPLFVIQQHQASNMHYDFRLEMDGVLLSWVIPKGLSTNPNEKRLAIQTEDHPLDYANFEGVIPQGQYGAGKVIVWDRGYFNNLKKDDDGNTISLKKCHQNGQIEVWLHGKKVEGGYALVEFREDKGQWLLIKMKDDKADARRNPVSTETKSVLSDKTIKEIGDEKQSR